MKLFNEDGDEYEVKNLYDEDGNLIGNLHDTEPAICNYGIITKTKLQEQIENILQSLKLNYLILDKNEEVISKQKNFNNN